MRKLFLVACVVSGIPSKRREFQNQLETSSLSHEESLPRDNINIVGGNGIFGVIQKKSIPLHQMKTWRKISTSTLARWLKIILTSSGIDVTKFQAHSFRGASTSAAFSAGITLDTIMKTANWKSAKTFKKFYLREVEAKGGVKTLKPLKPTFSQTSLSTEETVPLAVSCTSVGSRPPASFQWYIGSTNVTTFAIDTDSLITQDKTYTVLSKLTYHVNRSHNTKEVICTVTNTADLNGTQERRRLNVKCRYCFTCPYSRDLDGMHLFSSLNSLF
ncbi:unnamed protein product [Mytilus coruscus]|uniref:Ig-like domain-containing protein n=1 Tax=Mytilus coruscus TaxID=42192 RepID=A0A6J8A138_MYTCO|nr:unnamed protein product [Mytilus coruscus]